MEELAGPIRPGFQRLPSLRETRLHRVAASSSPAGTDEDPIWFSTKAKHSYRTTALIV